MENKENKTTIIRKTYESNITKTQQSDIQNLINVCSQKLDRDPLHKKALLIRASSYIKKNDLDRALIDAKALILNDNQNSTAYYLLGCIYEKKNDLEKAIENYNKAIETDGNNINALFSRGACYNKLGYYQKAIDDYYLALDKDSNKVNRKGMYRNISKVLGLNLDDIEKSIGENSIMNGSKLDSLNIESDIHQYVYNSLKDGDIKKSINDIGKSLKVETTKPEEVIKNDGPSNFIQIKKVEYNNKILDNNVFEEKNDEYNDLRNPYKREEKKSKNLIK